MKAIQFILIALVLFFTIAFFFKLRKGGYIKVLLLFFSGVGIYIILFPEATTSIGNWLGVGRGADLLLYFFMIGSFFSMIGLYAQHRRLKAQFTQIIRDRTIAEGVKLGKNKKID